jgi:hypothetical protein
MTYTAENFVASPAFVKIAVEDALAVVAKANGQTVELAAQAFALEVPNQVAKLVAKAAEHCAAEANAGRLWK